MKRIKVSLPQNRWSSLNTSSPANSSLVDPDEFTGDTKNLTTDAKGVITKRQGGTEFISGLTNAKDQYEAVFADGTHHLLVMDNGTLKYTAGANSLTTVQTGYSAIGNMEFAMYLDRVYFGNGIDQPQVYDRTASYGGVAYSPVPKTKNMGAQAPTAALTAAVGAAGNVPAGSYTYKVTFLYYDFEESNGGLASAVVSPGVASQITLTAIPVGGYGVTARKIYRSGDGGLTYRLVQTIADNTTVAGTDNVATGTALIPTDNATPRNGTFYVQHLDRIWVAGISGDPSELDFSEAGLPDIFPAFNTIICNTADPITGIVVFNDRVVVMNRHSFGEILGTTTDTFRYSEVPGNIGCVDNRTIQVRTINGVPLLIWLSDKGFYAWNGGSMQYISDKIEDLVDVNIQQANQVKGKNAQSTQADFTSGTASQGVDLATLPGAITTKGWLSGINPTNPKRRWETQADWEGGSRTDPGLVTQDVSLPDKATTKLLHNFNTSEGTFDNTILNPNGDVTLPTVSAYTGSGFIGTSDLVFLWTAPTNTYLRKQVFTRGGTLTQIEARWNHGSFGFGSSNLTRLVVYSDLNGAPHQRIFTNAGETNYNIGTKTYSHYTTLVIPDNTTLWIGTASTATINNNGCTLTLSAGAPPPVPPVYPSPTFRLLSTNLSTGDINADNGTTTFANNGFHIKFTVTQDIRSTAGSWTSTVLDTGIYPQTTAIDVSLVNYSTISSGQQILTYVQSSDSSDFTTFIETVKENVNGLVTVNMANTKRFWRLKMVLSTSNDLTTPTLIGTVLFPPRLSFPINIYWESEVIDCSDDVTEYTEISRSATLTSGFSFAYLKVATSTSPSGPWTFVDVSSAVVRRYVKIQIQLTSNPAYRPILNSVTFYWKVVANLQSYHIDTGSIPAGWDVFQTSYEPNGGTAVFELRTATTEGGLAAATYYTVTNGTFPTVPINRWAQWRVTITSEADKVPVVDSVTQNWFVSLTGTLRPASIFWDKSYYISVAEFGNTLNNLLLEFDSDGFWRVHRGVNIATFSLFFNNPYYTDAVLDKVVKFASADTDLGTPIELLAETKELDFGSSTAYKVLRWIKVVGVGTGAVYTFTYSVDGGNTYLPLITNTGSTIVTTVNDGKVFTVSLVPQWPNEIQGLTVKIKCVESTTAEVELHELHFNVLVRQGDLLDA